MKKTLLSMIFIFLLLSSVYAKEMITITDMAGRKVTIPKKVEKVVALSASLRYIVYLQAFDRVAGIEGVEKHRIMKGNIATGKAYWLAIKDRVHTIPSVGEGGPGKLPDFEKLIAVNPDLVITFEVDNAQLIQSRTGIPVVVIQYARTEGFRIEDIQNTFNFLGKILQKEKRAEELNRYINQCIAEIERKTKNSNKPSVYIGAISARGAHGITSSEADYPPLRWLNVKNVVDDTRKKGHIFIDREKLLVWNPDYIFIDTGGFSLVNDDYLKNKEFYKKLKALREGRVYTVFPYNFYRTNLEILIANAYFIGKVIYPERFRDINPQKKAEEIFRKFLGIDVYGDLKSVYRGYGKVEFKESEITVH
ncbi:MAG TPA: iron ABC transporter substrate-binding protein [Thermodesulfovibrio thiophilus]|uniref:iron ABC transporter substrate-binding protein n=1 Tax=Thermodesulfovibrio thiophilus TaxID=340095 RepID=UPI0017D52093|nr:iron ABC transporter substrate-binding protein [Thermodesulfovibrio thiophilus]HHW21252.1 iron ABC transporter substrate-binding protein [Thermodesulfovibrio thiophilus]HQA04579.1 iron ABC transporter substrate-binding protein [Thermodesulfovibrio thiophilus]HQD37073.1 iron ABC transporter substrate-binding protein [Thermodesulfovibrio thiophilus]